MNKRLTEIQEKLYCSDELIGLSKDDIALAMQRGGKYFYIELDYNDLLKEPKEQKLYKKLIESLSILIAFEDEGNKQDMIENFLKYIHKNTQKEQHLQFGIKKVQTLTKYPVKIFFSEILPINQLEIAVGAKLYKYAEAKRSFLKESFQNFRSEISKEIGIPLLPINNYKDDTLDAYSIKLLHSESQKQICKCDIKNNNITDEVEIIQHYLQQLYSVFIKLYFKENN